MKLNPASSPLLFTLVLFSFFITTVLTSAIPATGAYDINSPPQSLPDAFGQSIDVRSSPLFRSPPDCGSSTFQQLCTAASGLHVLGVFKIPFLVSGALVSGARKVPATALPLTSDDLETRQQGECGKPFNPHCSSGSGLQAPRIFKLAALVAGVLTETKAVMASAIPVAVNKSVTEASDLVPSVESSRLSRSLTPPEFSSLKSLFPVDKRTKDIEARNRNIESYNTFLEARGDAMVERDMIGVPTAYCTCTEFNCWPDCCNAQSCHFPGTLQPGAASGLRVVGLAWCGLGLWDWTSQVSCEVI